MAVAPDPAAVADGSLKVVSVVFADLVGSTALQEAIDTESVRRVMARFYEGMRTVIERHGGAIQKFIGDAVVAVFGIPSVSEDDALRAVLCAAEMAEGLSRLNEELERDWGLRLQMRTGVNTGELVVSEEGILVGDTMNTAARLEQAAAAGEVLIGQTTYRLVRHHVQLEEVAHLELKGKTARVRAWRLVSVAPEPAASGAEAPLVGRLAELDRLRDALNEAITARACRLVTVIGSPGLGKSRLAREFALSVRDQARVLEGHCEPSGEGITFLPVAEVLRAAADVGETDAPDVVIEKLAAVAAADPERDLVVKRAAAVLGAAEPGSAEETFWGVRRVLEALARERQLVVVLDDLHWGQPMFLDLIEHLVEWVRDAPLLLVALARPELREAREAMTSAGRRAGDVIELEPLDSGESRELVSGLLGLADLGDELLDRILETTEGNPLFLSELLRMLVDEGALERDGEVWVASGGAQAVEVPPTIQALLTARIERLRADERSVVERAAVIGKQFYRGAVAELVAPPVRSGIDGHLETLRRKDMVEPEGTYWIDEPVYRFHHVLIRDAAYHLLLKEARAELHEKFADWLAAKAGELVGEHEEVIAYHLEQAYRYRRQLGPLDDRGRGIGERAAELLWSAGRRALAREDLAAAANLLQRAHDCGAGHSVLWDLAEALLSAGDTARAAVVVEKLSGPRQVVLETQLALLTGTGTDLERIIAATEELAAADDGVGTAKGHHVTAQVQAQLGQVADVEASLDRALLAARGAGDRRRITAVLAAAPRAALWGPSPVVRASGRCLDVVRILRMTPGNRHVEAIALRCQAVLEAMRGRADAAREILAAGRTTLEELGLTLELQELAVHAGIVELLDGRPGAAEALLRPAREGFAVLGVAVSAAQAAALLARALVDQGRDEEAIAETEFAEQRGGGDLKTTITWCGVRAEALARRGALDEAVALARRAVALAEPTDALADKADANMALARVQLAAGGGGEARVVAAEAQRLYKEKDHVVGARRAQRLAGAPAETAARRLASVRDVSDPEVAEVLRQFDQAWRAHDYDRLLEIYPPGEAVVDHRQLGWAHLKGEKWTDAVRSVLEMWDDVRVEIAEVVACAHGVIAARMKWLGHSTETGGEIEIDLGTVTVTRDQRMVSVDYYEPDDRESMLARFEELSGGAVPLGDRLPERWWARFATLFAQHDRAGLAEMWSEDMVLVDHRAVGWDEEHGLDAMLDLADSAWTMSPDIRVVINEVIACDEHTSAILLTYAGSAADGGGAIEIPVGYVSVFANGRAIRGEQFDPSDRDAMLARYAELGGTRAVLGDSPSERLIAEHIRWFNQHEPDRVAELAADGFTYADHRPLPIQGHRGRQSYARAVRAVLDVAPDIRVRVEEVLACDNGAIALRALYGGTNPDGGGAAESPVGEVWAVRDGRLASLDQYDPDDRRAMLARYAELGGGLSKLGDKASERIFAESARRYAARDLSGMLAVQTSDWVLIDHRLVGWGEMDNERFAKEIEGVWQAAADARIEIDEVLAVDDRVLAGVYVYRGTAAGDAGGGRFEYPVGFVAANDGERCTRVDWYDPDDRDAVLARVGELRQPEAERCLAEYLRRWNAHDAEAAAKCLAEDWVLNDRRPLGVWDEVQGRAAWQAELRKVFASPGVEMRLEVRERLASDDHVIACLVRFGGKGHRVGDYELSMGWVATFADRKFQSLDMYEAADRRAMIRRYAELGGGTGPLRGRPPERVWAEYLKRWASRDIERLVSLVDDDVELSDHRELAWKPTRGDAHYERIMRAVFDTWSDSWIEIDQVLACDAERIALLVTYRGSGLRGATGAAEIRLGQVCAVQDGRFVSLDYFDPEDRAGMRARFAELGGQRPVLGDSPVERLVAEATAAFNEHDFDRHLLQHAEDFVLVDHRSIGWAEVRGREAFGELVRSALAVSDDVRFDIEEVIACDGERVIALRGAWRGDGSRKAGAWEIPVGYVTVFKDGRLASHDFYDYDATDAMRVRFAELSASPRPRGTRSDDAFNRRDLAAMAESYAQDIVLVDHRRAGWESVDGREAVLEQAASLWQHMSDDIQVVSHEVIASDGRAFARVASYRGTARDGGGELDLALGQVGLMSGDQIERLEWFEPDDRRAMIERYVELGGGRRRLGGRAPERWWAEVLKAYASGDVEKLAQAYVEDWRGVDHRNLGWEETRGRHGIAGFWQSALSVSTDQHGQIDEVLACDERVIAVRITWRGRMAVGGGEYALQTGNVSVVQSGRSVSEDAFDHDDIDGMLARYRELGGTPEARDDRPPERFLARFVERFDAHDVDALLALRSADWVQVDHRRIGWGESRGRDAAEELIRSAFAASPDVRLEIDEIIACDDRVAVFVGAWRGSNVDGGGDVAIPIGVVAVIENGTLEREELYEPEQRREMIARYVELGGGGGPLGDRPPERWWKEFQSAYASGDVDRLVELQADDLENADHRSLAWEQLHGKADIAQFWASPFEVSDHIHVDVDELLACDDRVIAVLVTYHGTGKDGGGQFSIPLGSLSVIENGRRVSMDIYDADERDAMLARFAELTTPEPVRIMTEYLRCLTAGDLEGALAVVADDFELTDRRDLALWDDLRGHDGIRRLWASFNDPEINVRGELEHVIACDEHVIAHTARLSGTAIQAADYELELGSVSVFEDGKWVRCEMYEPTDTRGMLARYAELTAPAGPEPVLRHYLRALERRDIDGLRAMVDPEIAIADRRAIAGPPGHGPDAAMELAHSALGVTSELRFEIDQIIAQDDHAIACNGTWIGRAAEGEGEVTLPMALLMSVKDERIAAFELYDLDAAEAIRARFDQLSLAALRPYHRFDRLYNERRLDEIPALYTDDYVMIDRRSMAWEEIHGGQALVETCRSFLDSAPDLRSVCAVLEEDESGEVVLLRNTFTGQGYTAGGAATGPVELVFIEVGVQRGEQICRTELFDPVDEPVARARYDELRAERAATPGARAAFEFDRLFNAKRFDELRDLYTEDFVMLDHRQLGWEERRGQEVMIDHIRSTLAISPEERSRCEPIADDGGDVVIYRDRFSGEGHGGAGPWELVLDLVIVVRDGKVARIESFDPADEEARTARFDELRDPRPLPGRLYVAMCDAFNERDLDRAISLHQPDTVMRDHRRMPWEPTDTVAELAEVWRAVAESVTDARYQPDFHLVTDEHACVTLRVEAQPDYGGGPAEVVMAVAVGTCDGLMDRHEIYDDPGDALARTGELIGGERGATVTLIARYLQAYRDRDWERMAQLWAPDALLEDHRPAGLGVVEGVDGIVQAIRGLVELAADARTHAREFLELRDGAALYRHEVSGHDATGGAIALEMLIAAKVVDGRFARAEMFALTGESAARRRFAAL